MKNKKLVYCCPHLYDMNEAADRAQCHVGSGASGMADEVATSCTIGNAADRGGIAASAEYTCVNGIIANTKADSYCGAGGTASIEYASLCANGDHDEGAYSVINTSGSCSNGGSIAQFWDGK